MSPCGKQGSSTLGTQLPGGSTAVAPASSGGGGIVGVGIVGVSVGVGGPATDAKSETSSAVATPMVNQEVVVVDPVLPPPGPYMSRVESHGFGAPEQALWGHTATLVGDEIVLLGGCCDSSSSSPSSSSSSSMAQLQFMQQVAVFDAGT